MNNSKGANKLFSSISFPNVNLVKVIMVLNLWIFLFVQFFVLVPVTAYAATANKMTDVTYTQSYKSGEMYDTKVTVTGTGTVGISNVVSTLGRQVATPKSIKTGSFFNFEIKCGDTVTMTIDGVNKEIKSPACTGKPDGDYTPNSTCTNPVGWVEAGNESTVQNGKTVENIPAIPSKEDVGKGETWTKYYFAVDRKTILATDTPSKNPDKFLGTYCIGTSKQNYKTQDGKYQKINNKIIPQTVGKFAYSSTGNDYKAYFAAQAKDGFKFTTSEGSTIEVVKVTVGGVELKTPKAPSISGDSITYYSVLPDVDLIYQLDNTGVTKQLVLRNQNALKNNLSKIEFELSSDAKLQKESQAETKLDQKIVDNKVDKKSTKVEDIKKQKAAVDNVIPVVKSPVLVKVDDKALNELASAKSTELDKLAKQIEKKEIVDVVSELDRIDNLPVSDEKVKLTTSTNAVQIELPVSYSQNDSSLLKSESVKISANGKTLTILPDISSLKKLDAKSFPYIIDPRFYGYATPAEDTYIGNDGTRSASRGYQRSMTVGARPEGGVAAVYLDGYNGSIGDAAAFIKFDVPGDISASAISSANLILRQYGSWNTGGFNAQIIKTSWFSESSLTYYDNRPIEYGEYGNINFTNVNTNCQSCFLNAWSSDISQIIREGNRQMYLKVMDRTATSKSATFCSKDGNIAGHPCNQSWNGPLLQIYLQGSPTAPVNQGPNYTDQVLGCTGQKCQNSTDIQYLTSGMNDGYANCISNNIYQTTSESQGFQNWRNTEFLGANASFFWNFTTKHIADYGATCGSWFGYWERKLSGNYYHDRKLTNTDNAESGWAGGLIYSVDTSAPVQIEANTINFPEYKNNGNISFTIPKFIDDARTAVTITNAEGGVIDADGSIKYNSLDTQIDTKVYGASSKNVFQSWVIESNGQIRTLADGRCLTYKGGDLQMSTLRCQFNSTYTTNAAQGYEYLTDSKQIRLINDRTWCIAKEGVNLMLRKCTSANNQKWDLNLVDEPVWAGYTDKVVSEKVLAYAGTTTNIVNKSVQYTVFVNEAKTGTLVKQTEWNTTRNISISGLENGKKYNFGMQARDRVTGTANYSEYIYLGSTTIDTDLPKLMNFVVDGNVKLFSPNNPTSVGTLDTVTFSYEMYDKNPLDAFVEVQNYNGSSLIRRLGYDPTKDTTGKPVLTPDAWRQYKFTWDGKDQNGNYVADGIYVVKALMRDQTCKGLNIESTDPNCNRYNKYEEIVIRVRVDNLGANISVVMPEYNIWTNQKNYTINGGLAVVNDNSLMDSTDKDIQSLYINNVSVPFTKVDSLGKYNFKYDVTLNPGVNNFTFRSVDQVGNTISNFNQVDRSGVVRAVRSVLPLNYDPVSPKINSIVETTPAGTIKSTKNIKITFSDDMSGINTNNIAFELFSSTKDKVGYIVDRTKYSRTISCTSSECNLTLQNLPDSYYQLFVSVSDNATNNTCTFIQSPYACNTLTDFEKIFQVGTPVDGNLIGSDQDTSRGLLSVNVDPTYDGINSDALLNELVAGTKTLDDVQKVKFKIKVTQGTEAADLEFSYDTAINYPCPNVATDPTCTKRIATLNNTLDTRRQYLGQNANVSTKWGTYPQEKSTITSKKCDQVECTWEYNIVYDWRFMGGFPKVVVTTYKGMTVDKQTVQWEVNGQLKGDPRVILFDKVNGTNSENANVYNKIYYTNQLTNRILVGSDAYKSYTLTFRNGVNSFTKAFTADAFGSTYVDFTLPSVDGTWEISYNGLTFQKFVLDRVVPILSTVTTTNLSNNKAVMPFIRRGDNVKFDYTTSEPVWESNLLLDQTQKVFAEKVTVGCETTPSFALQYGLGTQSCNDGWRNSVTNTSTYQINNWNGGVTGVDGIVNPKIELVDYAGNKSSISSTVQSAPVYSQTPRGTTTGANIDFRLFADSISPDKSDFDTTSWLDGKDGVVADGVNPESDRLVSDRWVIRGNTITFKVKGERNARAVFTMNGAEQTTNATSTNCIAGNNTTVNGLIVKFAEICNVSFTYNWTGTGSQNELGEALDYKNFQFYTIDLAGNTSAYSNSIMVWNDRSGAVAPTATIVSKVAEKPVVGSGDSYYTNSNLVDVILNGEQKTDTEYQITNPKNVISTRVQRQGQVTNQSGVVSGNTYLMNCVIVGCSTTTTIDYSKSEAIMNLGSTVSDTSFTTTNGSRVGTGEDGVYTILVRNTDTAGNRGAWKTLTVERDTVAPANPSVSSSFENGEVYLTISGETGTNVLISGSTTSTGYISGTSTKIKVLSNFEYITTYSWNVTLTDRGGNKSTSTSASYTTIGSPTRVTACLAGSAGLIYPGTKIYGVANGFNDSNPTEMQDKVGNLHNGTDLLFPANTEVIAVMSGTVSRQTDQYGGNGIVITSGNTQTIYWHLSRFAVPNGPITQGQVIGYSGMTGLATGYHLHFGVKINGNYVDPMKQLKCAPASGTTTGGTGGATTFPDAYYSNSLPFENGDSISSLSEEIKTLILKDWDYFIFSSNNEDNRKIQQCYNLMFGGAKNPFDLYFGIRGCVDGGVQAQVDRIWNFIQYQHGILEGVAQDAIDNATGLWDLAKLLFSAPSMDQAMQDIFNKIVQVLSNPENVYRIGMALLIFLYPNTYGKQFIINNIDTVYNMTIRGLQNVRNYLRDTKFSEKMEVIGKAIGYVGTEIVIWVVGAYVGVDELKGSEAIANLLTRIGEGADKLKDAARVSEIFAKAATKLNELAENIGKLYKYVVKVIRNGISVAVELVFTVDDLGGGLAGMKYENFMNFSNAHAADEITELSKIAKGDDVAQVMNESKKLLDNPVKSKYKVANIGCTGRTTPSNIAEKMVMNEIFADPDLGTKMANLHMSDTGRWEEVNGWYKFAYSKKVSGGTNIEIHYLKKINPNTGIVELVDDFKFKDN